MFNGGTVHLLLKRWRLTEDTTVAATADQEHCIAPHDEASTQREDERNAAPGALERGADGQQGQQQQQEQGRRGKKEGSVALRRHQRSSHDREHGSPWCGDVHAADASVKLLLQA